MIIYEEPDINDPKKVNQVIRTEKEAIEIMKKIASKNNNTYPNDETALQDYMVIHWAWKKLEPNEIIKCGDNNNGKINKRNNIR